MLKLSFVPTRFMGIVLALELCDHVTVYEFVPSVKYSHRCHYWDEFDVNKYCTSGTWHPMAWEKRLMRRMHHRSEEDLYVNGKLRLKGYENLACDKTL